MVRLGDKRFLSKKTAFDAILGFILASMLARAVNGYVCFLANARWRIWYWFSFIGRWPFPRGAGIDLGI